MDPSAAFSDVAQMMAMFAQMHEEGKQARLLAAEEAREARKLAGEEARAEEDRRAEREQEEEKRREERRADQERWMILLTANQEATQLSTAAVERQRLRDEEARKTEVEIIRLDRIAERKEDALRAGEREKKRAARDAPKLAPLKVIDDLETFPRAT